MTRAFSLLLASRAFDQAADFIELFSDLWNLPVDCTAMQGHAKHCSYIFVYSRTCGHQLRSALKYTAT